ncbi:aspartate/glutamate racemase family protein [Xylophilus sp. GOD-11R]|uniref:aspartate/glutamate racemase family protein n=1 Tax=Xylophilus sp. GOD-11R TaxID=3089814 RepID=UPI00298C478F|nr:amino acid racemase [Xylophilus sp. GOD-11R]WPB59339.1 amino acid racemase [Xylophilus sp. GOD-11R]
MRDAGVVGVLGGMGPLATVDFLRKVIVATPAQVDQDHVPVLASSIPQVPDRTAAFRGVGESPLPALVASGQRLVRAGAGLIVIPCNTAHLWFEPLADTLRLPMLHLVDAALAEARALAGTRARIGLLGTEATLASGLYTGRGRPGLRWLLPTDTEMARLVTPGIWAVKAGDTAAATALLRQAAQALADRGAETIVLGCTEIPLVLDMALSPVPVIDATAALARRSVAWSLEQVALVASAA